MAATPLAGAAANCSASLRSVPSSFYGIPSFHFLAVGPESAASGLKRKLLRTAGCSRLSQKDSIHCHSLIEVESSVGATEDETHITAFVLVRHTLKTLQGCRALLLLPLKLLLDIPFSFGGSEHHLFSWQLNLKRKGFAFIIGSTIIALLITCGVTPSSYTSSQTWALTEENLLFLEAWRTIDRAYVDKTFNGQSWFRYREEALRREPMNNRKQTYAAIQRMLATLDDPFTRFLEPEKFKSLRSGTTGAITGVGLEVGFDMSDYGSSTNLVVVAPVAGGPAERAGIVPGDVILAIDGADTQGMGLYDAAQRLQGPESSEVELTLHCKGSSQRRVILQREKITINPVIWRLCEITADNIKLMKIGYIRLTTFNQNSARAVKDAIEHLREDRAMAYILDIRNNNGGLFPAGIEIAKMWLKDGVIVYIADSAGIRDIYEADGNEAIVTKEPLVVLVNRGTASASEILAGALKDNRRAVILGDRTFGKGKIQSVFELSDGSGLAVTVARYETPAHINIDKVGILPDYELPPSIPMDADSFCKCLADSSLPCYISSSMLLSR
eukprot:c22205_g1_i1 orf=60-1730(+)